MIKINRMNSCSIWGCLLYTGPVIFFKILKLESLFCSYGSMNLASSEACLSSEETKSLLASLQEGLRTKGHVYNQIDTILS